MPSCECGWALLGWGIIPKKLGHCTSRCESGLSDATMGLVLSLGTRC
jgi:hypothetical protein